MSVLVQVVGEEVTVVEVAGVAGATGATGPNAVSNTTAVGTISDPAFSVVEVWPADVLLIQETAEQGGPDRLRRARWTVQAAVEATAAGTKTLIYESGVKYLFEQAKGAKTTSGTATVSVQIDAGSGPVEVDTFTVTTTPTDVPLASAPWPGVPVAVGETLTVVVSGTFTGLIFNLFGWRV